MSTLSVGSMTVGMNVDLTNFQSGMQRATDLARSSTSNMSVEMKRSSKEGAESFRLIDEAIGLHLSRPITKLLTEQFPGLATGLQSILGAGLTGAVGVAAFEFISSGIEKVSRSLEEAKKKQEEYEQATRKLNDTLAQQEIAFRNSDAQIRAHIAELQGNTGEANRLKLEILSSEDAEETIKRIDDVFQEEQKQVKAAAEAARTHWRAVIAEFAHQTFSWSVTLKTEKINAQLEDFRHKLDDASQFDALHNTHTTAALITEELEKQRKILADMESGGKQSSISSKIWDAVSANYGIPRKVLPAGSTPSETSAQTQLIADVQHAADIQAEQDKKHADRVKELSLQSKKEDAGDNRAERTFDKFRAETAAQISLAEATDKTTAAQNLLKASGEADQIISQILTEAHGKLTAKLQEEIGTVHALAAERQLAKDITAVSSEMQKQTEEIQRNIAASREMAEAYVEGGQAIENARIDQKLAPEIQKLKDLELEYDLAKQKADEYAAAKERLGGAVGPVPGLNIPTADLGRMKAAIDQQKQVLEQQRIDLHIADLATYQEEINKTADAMRGEQPLIDAFNDSYLQGAEAIRKAQNALALYNWEKAHPGQSAEQATATLSSPNSTDKEREAAQQRLDQLAAVKIQLDQASINAQRSADARAAAEYSVTRALDDELQRLGRIREVLQQNGQSTLQIDAAIQDAQERYLRTWDDAVFKVGTFDQKFKAVMNEVVLQGKQASENMARSWLVAIDEVNDGLAKIATGQKADFKHIVQNLAEQQTKGELQKFEGSIAGHFGIKIPGLEGKPDGSAEKPFNVVMKSGAKDSADKTITGLTKNPFDAVKGILGIGSAGAGTSVPDGSQSNPFFVMMAAGSFLSSSSGSPDFSKLLSNPFSQPSSDSGFPNLAGLFSGFGGFRAEGGDVFAGLDYIVGEKGPELLRIPATGHVVSNSNLKNVGGSTDNSRTNHVTQHFHGNQDKDSMGRTMKQNLNRILRHIR